MIEAKTVHGKPCVKNLWREWVNTFVIYLIDSIYYSTILCPKVFMICIDKKMGLTPLRALFGVSIINGLRDFDLPLQIVEKV